MFLFYFLFSASQLEVAHTQFMSVDELKPGMKGYGLTVFKGTKIDTFNVEIIDVMKKDTPKGDIILVRISGKIVDTAGVIAGMSGSPIYIYEDTSHNPQDAKLIGALAYSYAVFAKEHLAGITPIKEMLNPPSIEYIPSGEERSQIKLPICGEGFPDQILEELKKEFPTFNVIKTQQSGSIIEDSIIPSPGLSLGIPFVIGDVVWGGIGTCTYKEGNKIWGFGHPMAVLGETELPMTAGYVYSIVSSSYHSYKMAVPTKVIGTIKNDNSRGVIGVIGEIPKLVTLNLMIKKDRHPEERKFHYQIIKEKTFLPLLFSGLVLYSIYTGAKLRGDMTAEIKLEVKWSSPQDSTKDFYFKNLCTGTPQNISNSISEIFTLIQNNPFQKIDIEEIRVDLTTSDTIKQAKIDEVWVDRKEVKPGDTLNLLISLLTYQGGKERKQVKIRIPASAKKGDLSVKVEAGKTIREQAKSHISTIDEFIRWLSTSPRDNEIAITLTQKGRSGWIAGNEFSSLPPSVASFIKGEDKVESKIFELRIPTDWVIVQKKSIKLEVK